MELYPFAQGSEVQEQIVNRYQGSASTNSSTIEQKSRRCPAKGFTCNELLSASENIDVRY